jgi:magnesium transporter
VILLPLTLISGIWGMNVRVPGEGSIEAFWAIIGIMVVVLSGLLLFFRRRGWL